MCPAQSDEIFKDPDNPSAKFRVACSQVSVRDVMTRDPVSIHEGESVENIFELFNNYHFHTYPVVDDKGSFIGVVDQNLILQLLLVNRTPRLDHTHLMAVKSSSDDARGIMVSHPVTVPSDTSLCDAADLMIKHKMDRFCVVDDGNLVGIICKADVIKKVYELRGL
ncbi:CBS domain-containing protein [Methanohalophilus levihalophilus]|uniref:CBS domain-containing protein n=1 Tax=Methanohalophilus levihalophilus TaxID=1431282 RepID=UPI001AE2F0F8|nr:CBS domain-containing protein [Methanohalophilus levihalophilus]MBP2029885.1 CBS domain-containing protein [Methanohalophilus levihalophilus]